MRLSLLFVVTLTACTSFPELDRAESPGVSSAPFPGLLPMERLLTGPDAQIAEGDGDAILARADSIRGYGTPRARGPATADAARVARLRTRAAELRQIQ